MQFLFVFLQTLLIGSTGAEINLLDLIKSQEECVHDPVELALILDSSSSIHPRDYRKAKQFLQDFVSTYDIGPDRVRISIITFGKGIYPEDGFNLTTYSTKEEVVSAISAIPHRAGLYTATWAALDHMLHVQLADSEVRPGVDKVCVVITDGNSQLPKQTKAEAEEAIEKKVTIFAVGVGYRVNQQELINIAGGDETRVTRVRNFDALEKIKERLVTQTCTKKIPATEPPQMDQTCGQQFPSDVNFVFSPASLGLEATAWTTSFVAQTVSTEDMKDGFRYGVISGSCPEDEGFKLDAFDNVDDIKERLQDYDRTRLPYLIEKLAVKGYTEDFGGRPNAQKVAVIVANSDHKGQQELLNLSVSALNEAGVRVFIVDPYGGHLEVKGAETLPGGSSRQVSEHLVGKLCSPV